MNHYFKVYLKNASIGAVKCATIGAACGSAAGIAGLHQICSGKMESETCDKLIPMIIPYVKSYAASSGAAVGAAVGVGIGVTVYPAYVGIVNLYNNSTKRRTVKNQDEPSYLDEIKQRVAL